MNQSRLVDTADIAKLLGVTRATATNRITKRPGFPAPAINLNQRLRKWRADEVLAWIRASSKSNTR